MVDDVEAGKDPLGVSRADEPPRRVESGVFTVSTGSARPAARRPLRISAPRNRFPLAPARRHLLFAGGIGITPLLAMARHLDAEGGDYTLHYCARSRTDAAFASGLADHPRVVLHFDDGDPGRLLDAQQALGTRNRTQPSTCAGPAASWTTS